MIKSFTTAIRCLWVIASVILFADQTSAQTAPISPPAGGFQIDGNVLSNTPTANVGDWVSGPGGTGGGVLTSAGVAIDASKTIHVIDAYSSGSDITFTGSKANANPNDITKFKWVASTVSNKSDIHNACVHLAKNSANNHTWIAFSGDRLSTSGTTYIDFEFLQNTLTRSTGGGFSSAGPHGGRTVNDFVLTVEYTNGGATAVIGYYKWTEISAGTYDYVQVTPSTSIGFAFTSSANTSVPYGAFGGTTYGTNAFVEGAVDLDAFLGTIASACAGLNIKTVFIKTKASAAITANLEDLVEPIQVTFDIGFSASASASPILCNGQNSTVTVTANNGTAPYQYKMGNGSWQSSNTFSVAAGGPYTFYVQDANGCTTTGTSISVSQPAILGISASVGNESWAGAANGSISATATGGTSPYTYTISGPTVNTSGQSTGSFSGLSAGNYTVTVSDANGCSKNTLVNIANTCQIPACSITGSNSVCPGVSGITYTAPAGMTSYAWQILSGGASISSASNQQSVTLSTSPSCGSFVIQLTIFQNICSSTCSITVQVADNTPPSFNNLPANNTVSCGQLPTVASFGVTASDNCDSNVSVTSTFTDAANGCNTVRTITWTATDDCGNVTTATRTFTTQDTTGPQLIGVPSDASLECGLPVPNAVVSALDNCDANPIVSLQATTVPSSCGYSLIRTWTATDACGNTSTASQTTIFVDTTLPNLTGLPDNETVNCGLLPDPNDFNVTASDNCVNEVILTASYTDAGSGCNTQRTIVWTAVDGCGNTATATRVFTTADNGAPILSGLPESSTVACSAIPDGDDFAVIATDNCDSSVDITININDNNSGCNQVRTITWTATDDCGNQSSATRVFTGNDNQAPQLIGVPANASLECGQAVPDAVVSAIDNCDDQPVVSLSATTVPATCGYSLVRTWTAIDACGNAVSASQTTTFTDSTAPVLNGLPANGTASCADMPVAEDFNVTASDNCVNAVQLTSSISDAGAGCTITRTITWTATDACGNTTSASRTFTSVDDTAPVLVGVPSNATLECGQAVPEAVVTAIDNCDNAPVVSLNAVTVPSSCGYTLIRTWTATDICGNTSSASQTTTFTDITAPELHNLPSNSTVDCDAVPYPEDFNVTASDNCVNDINLSAIFTDSGSGCNVIRTITWTAIDGCGNTVNASRTFTTQDNIAPVFSNIPANATIGCEVLPTGGDYAITASDNCDEDVVITSSYSDNGEGCNTVRTITWVATDDCGNHSSVSRSFTTQDTAAPQLIGVPANATMECGQPVPNAVVSAIDNCDSNPVVSLSATTVPAACGYTLIRTWTATDACGNTSSASQTTTFEDTTDPVLAGIPENSTVSCSYLPDASDFEVTATDNCVNGASVSADIQDTGSGCNVIRVITWTATDGCGNTSSVSRTFTTEDNGNPIIAGLPESTTVNCGELPDGDDFAVFATDNCDETVSLNYSTADSNVGCNLQRTITWTATDDCGNTSTASRVFTSNDNIAPILIGVPQDATMECGQSVPTAVVSALDNCDANPVVSLSAVTVPDRCGYSLVRTWTAVDACGNEASASQVTTFEDTTDPVLNGLPDNTVVACGSLPDADEFNVSATDNCVNPIEIIHTTTDAGGGCNIVRTITWTATDACGNSSSASRTFTTEDNIDPVFVNLPQNGSVLCGGLPSTTQYNVSASDNCDTNVNITIASSDEGSGCNVVRTLTWTATDDCGNTVSASRTFTTQDNQAPQLVGVPQNTTMQCGQPVPNSVVTAIDNCDLEPTISLEAVTVPAECGYSLVRTWTATDDCGNVATASQTTLFIDTTNPVLTGLPQNQTVDCGSLPNADDFAVSATDNCVNEVEVTSNVQDAGTGCNVTRTITWTATDACGNSVSASRTFATQDNLAPMLNNLPIEENVNCGELPNASQFNVTAMDNCDNNVNVTVTFSDSGSGCTLTRTFTWTATDDCGNTSNASRTFATEDNENPILLDIPADAVMECGQSVPTAVVSALDNCDTDLTVSLSAVTVPAECGYALVRTWTATDDCGNSVSASQTTTFEDHTLPVLNNLPSNGNFTCSMLPNEDDFIVSATDNCTSNMQVSVNVQDQGSGCDLVRTITWTATDDCGNTASASRTFNAVDETAPVLIGVPANASISCEQLTGPPSVTATDDCIANIEVSYSESISEGCPYVITRTWTATDYCGNQTSASQQITVSDNIAPQIFGSFEDLTIECDDVIPPSDAWALDNCDPNVVMALSAETQSDGCMQIFTRTWTAMDLCGNTSTISQTIYIVDETVPVFSSYPQDITVNCGDLPAAPELSATDNCDSDVQITFSETAMSSGCPYQIKRVWTASDNCDNTAVVAQVITVVDNEAPEFINSTEIVELECDDLAAYIPAASDNCASEVYVQMTGETWLETGCLGQVQRTYTASDECGNTSSMTQIIEVVDNTPPLLLNIPNELFIQCGDALPPVATDVTATDNCSADVTITFSQSQTSNQCPYNIIRTWTATDDCGNISTRAQTIHVISPQPAGAYMNAFPNPSTNGRTRLQFSVPKDAQVEGAIYDVSGRMVQELMKGPALGGMVYEWNSSDLQLSVGTYFMKMMVDGKPYIKQFMLTDK